jgi:hypothetical protein
MPLGTPRKIGTAKKLGKLKKTKLLTDRINKVEDYREALTREIVQGSEAAALLDDDTARAHTIYLFGENGRRPVRDIEELSLMTGVDAVRLRMVAPAWRREAMRLAREASPLFNMAASTKARADHHKDLDKMRVRIEEFEALLPSVESADFPAKYRMLMMMRKEWQDAAGVSAAIEISKMCILMEAKQMITAPPKEPEDGGEDLSAFDIDV